MNINLFKKVTWSFSNDKFCKENPKTPKIKNPNEVLQVASQTNQFEGGAIQLIISYPYLL